MIHGQPAYLRSNVNVNVNVVHSAYKLCTYVLSASHPAVHNSQLLLGATSRLRALWLRSIG